MFINIQLLNTLIILIEVCNVLSEIVRLPQCNKFGGSFSVVKEGYKIDNNSTIRSPLEVSSLEECIGHCIHEVKCFSICYNAASVTCELHSLNMSDTNLNLSPAAGWMYMQTKDGETYGHACSESKCRNGRCNELCEAPFYQCICNQGYEGSDCQLEIPTCRTKYTSYTSLSNVLVREIENHPFYCNVNEALKEFQVVVEPLRNEWRYRYICCSLPSSGCQKESVDHSAKELTSIVFLDRQNINCPNAGTINHFWMSTWGIINNIMHATPDVECCANPNQNGADCYEDTITSSMASDNLNITSMSSLNVSCRQYTYLSRFRMLPRDGSWTYDIRCCAM